MKKLIIITDKPNFYKTNLFNKINEHIKIHVVYINEEKIMRQDFFYSDDNHFYHTHLTGAKIMKIFKLIRIIRLNQPSSIIVSGWDNIIYIFILIFFKTNVIIESTLNDKERSGLLPSIKYFMKKIVLFRVEKFLCSGFRQEKYAKSLYADKKTILTKSVGFPFQNDFKPSKETSSKKDFVFIGRNSPEKNVDFMISVFNKSKLSQDGTLYLVGDNFTQFRQYENIIIVPKLNREEIVPFLEKFRALILLSISEPYGLVAEEALRCGVPVLVSNNCGIVDTMVFDEQNGLVLNISSFEDSIDKFNYFPVIEKQLVENIKKMDFRKFDEYVVQSFIE